MSALKIATAISEVAVFFKRLWVRSEKEQYEKDRLKSEASAADDFEREFNPNGLRSESGKLQRNKTDNGEGR